MSAAVARVAEARRHYVGPGSLLTVQPVSLPVRTPFQQELIPADRPMGCIAAEEHGAGLLMKVPHKCSPRSELLATVPAFRFAVA